MLRCINNRRAQAVSSEYVLVILLMLGAIAAMTVYFKRGVQALSQYCQKCYFPPHYSGIDGSDMLQTVYETRGSLYEAKDHTVVSLEIPQDSACRKDIEYALRRVNERHIFDHFGRKLWIEI